MSGKIMMEELRDPTRIREGDLLLWPAETGKVNHLHGSASTMRKLGFSVGNRWRAASYDQLKIIQTDPARPRFLIVRSKTELGIASTAVDDMLSLGGNTDARVKDVTVSELPVGDLKDGEYDLRAWALASCDVILNQAHAVSAPPYALGFRPGDEDKFLAQAIDDRESWEWHDVGEGGTDCLDLPIASGDERTNPMTYDSYKDVCVAVSEQPRNHHTVEEFMITIPATVLTGAARYGMKAFRLTEEGRKAIGIRYARYYASMAERRYLELYGRVTEVYLRLGKDKGSLKERSEKFGIAKRALARANAKAEKEVCDVLERK